MTPELHDDELLRSYLLGKLPEEDADTLERRLLAEDDLFNLAEAVEMDLLASFDRGAFTPEEKEEVLRRLAATPRGRERLAFARSLNTLATEAKRKRFYHGAIFQPPAIRWMALAASLVMVVSLGRLAWQYRDDAPKTDIRGATTPAPTPTPQVSITPPPTPTPPPPPPPPPPRPRAVPTAVLPLSFLTLRGVEDRQRLELAPNIRRVEIQIDAEGLGEAKSFAVAIRSKDQETSIMEKKGLTPRKLSWGSGLILHIPANRLPAGRYKIAVTPRGGIETVQDFEVVEVKR